MAAIDGSLDGWAYFDFAATMPVTEAALAVFVETLSRFPANTGATYAPGLAARQALEDARAQFAAVIHADPREIVFTSGATEADNLALKGALWYHGVKQPHLLTVQTEHKAVLDTAAALAKTAKVTVLPVQRDGLLDMDALDAALQTAPTLVSVMAVNNETGVVQPLAAIAARVHAAGAKFHVDAAQALGKLPVDVRAWDADLVSFSGHKCGAPQGIGALFVRRLPKMRLQALAHGGGQERSRRSGTSPLALIRAFAVAAAQAEAGREANGATVAARRAQLLAALPASMHVNVPPQTPQVPHIVNLFTGVPSGEALRQADAARIALAAGSACTSAAEGSHVLQAMGLHDAAAHSLRISLSHTTASGEISRLAAYLEELGHDRS